MGRKEKNQVSDALIGRLLGMLLCIFISCKIPKEQEREEMPTSTGEAKAGGLQAQGQLL